MRSRRYLLLFLCLLIFEGCAGKKCKRCNGGGGGGGGGGAPKAGKGTHGDGQPNDNGVSPAPGIGEAGKGPSNENPFGSQFDQGNLAPGVGGSALAPEVNPNNLPSFPPPGTQGAPGFGGGGTGAVNPNFGFTPGTFPPTGGGTSIGPGNQGVHPGNGAAGGDSPGNLPNFSPNRPALRPITPALHSAMGKCVACHKQKGEQLSELLKGSDSLVDQFATMDVKHLEDMISRTPSLTPEELAAVRQHAADTRGARAALTAVKPGNARTACFMTEEQRQQLLQSLPPVTGNSPSAQFLQQSQKSGNIQFFDRTNVPLTWQTSKLIEKGNVVAESRLMGPHNATNPDMMEKMGYHSDGSREFPWKTTAGLDISPSGGATKFVIPPPQGPMMQVIAKNRQSHPSHFGNSGNASGPQMGWVYAPGTTFGETLRVRDPASGQMIPFEIRLRTKLPNGTWNMDVLRPFANSKELAAAVKQLCAGAGAPTECAQIQPQQRALENPQARVMALSNFVNQSAMGTRRDPLSLSRTAIEAAQATAAIETLPELPANIVRRLLLETPFKSVFGQPWNAGPPPGWAPTSGSDFNVVPRNYFAGFIPMNQNGCMKCHDSAGRHVDQFDPGPGQMFASAPNDATRARTWYNHIPGDDGILSFHPYSRSAVASGSLAAETSVDPCWVQSGLIR